MGSCFSSSSTAGSSAAKGNGMATQICACFQFNDAAKAIDWFNKVPQFKTSFRVDDPSGTGKVKHAELVLGAAVVMLGDVHKTTADTGAEQRTGGSAYIVLKDEATLRAHFEHAKKLDPESIDKEPFTTDYGSLDYSLKFENHILYFGTYSPQAA